MSFPVDYSGAWAVLDGIEDGTISPPLSATTAAVKVRKDLPTGKELSGGAFGIAPTDDAFFLWATGGTAPQQEGKLTVGAVSWTILQVVRRPDSAFWRIIARKRV